MKFFSAFLLVTNLAFAMGQFGDMFMPMHCNAGLERASCVSFSSQNFDLSETVEIPCGVCVKMDLAGVLVLEKGIDVQGKLIFPASRQALKITTPHVFVQGKLIIEQLADKAIPQPDKDLVFHFVGSDSVTFTSHHNQTFEKCEGGCNMSKKPFVVAGGSLDIQGMHDDCHTWSRLLSVNEAGSNTMNAIVAPSVRDGCSDILVDETFNDAAAIQGTWDAFGASYSVLDGYLSVTGGNHAPRVYLPFECITPGASYLLTFRYRYRHFSDETLLGFPYVKLVRGKVTGGSDWIGVDYVNGRGSISQAQNNQWYDYQTTIRFSEEMADATKTNSLFLYLEPNSAVDTMDLEKFEIKQASAVAFEGRSCNSLLVNGKAEFSNHIYPFYPIGGVLNLVDDGSTGPTGTPYFRNTMRTSTWNSILSQDVAPECLAKASIYSFSAYVRVDSLVARQVSFSLEAGSSSPITTCPPSANNTWVHCAGNILLTEEHEGADSAMLYTRVLSDDISTVDIADISFTYIGGRVTQLTLEDPSGVSQCWGEGAEVVVTSHTTQHESSQVATIKSVDLNGVITLEEPIYRPITVEDDPQTGVEVALLTRNIRLTAAEDDSESPLDGGHLIIMHTSAPTTQKIIGIESHGFGQQGKLGKYPIHFHMCGSVEGSLLSKLAVRNTKQRGVVVHGSNDLYLHENILHNTKGHGFMLEDGGETGNIFERNLGAVGNGVEIRISDAESDTDPATFWMTNPDNTWIGNVAAGSAFSGFWFEVSSRVRGPSRAIFPDMVPNTIALRYFVDNVSHSNQQGLQTYPQTGYRPENLAVFQNHKSYRNRLSGVFFHAGGRLSLDGAYLSDNKIAVDIDMDHSDVISNSIIIGSSTVYQDFVESVGVAAYQWPKVALCGTDNTLVGVRLDSFHDGHLFEATGTNILNVTFSGFGPSSCPGSTVLQVDDIDIKYFDTRNRIEQVVIADDSTKVDLCGGEPQVAIRDTDGSLFGDPGFIISDTNAIFAHPDCYSIDSSSCAAFCPGACLRSMTVSIPSYYERGALRLEVTGTLPDGREITPIYVEDFQTRYIELPRKESSHGRLFVTLPAGGNYKGRFFLNNSPVWPLYANLRYEDIEGNCGPDFVSFEIDELTPPQCNQLVKNGDFETGDDFWWHMGNLGLFHVNGGANGSLKSLMAPNSVADGGGRWVGVGQYLDTRCIEEGYAYSLSAKVKLTNSVTGVLVQCDLSGYSNVEPSCPGANLKFVNNIDGITSWASAGTMQENDKEWNTIEGIFVATAENAAAHAAFLYIAGAPADVDIVVDAISFTRTASSRSPSNAPSDTPYGAPPVSSDTPSLSPDNNNSPFESSNSESIKFDGDSIRLVTDSSQDSTVLTKMTYTGDLDMIVHFQDRFVSDGGYQPSLVLFFAPETASVEDLTTNDNDFGAHFESTVVAWMRERIYCCMDHTWFTVRARRHEDSVMTSSHGGENQKMDASGYLRLKRTKGIISGHYSFDDGVSWVQIGSDIILPESEQTAPLKMGFRIKREWHSSYDITTHPLLSSDGEVEPN